MNLRIRTLNDTAPRPDGDYVLYWMTSARRLRSNPALDRALHWARELDQPLVVFEALRVAYPWASDRFHRFLLEGMAEHVEAADGTAITYFPWVERKEGEGKGLLAALARPAGVVIADDRPDFFYPRMLEAAGRQVETCLEAVDGIGLLPYRAADKAYPTAYTFRRHLQKTLPDHLGDQPDPDPLVGLELPRLESLPASVREKWPAADPAGLAGSLDRFPIDHAVPPVAGAPGGESEGRRRLDRLVAHLDAYATDRNHPDAAVTSGLSPYLHFGMVGPHQVLAALAEREDWTPDRISGDTKGARAGWWNMSEGAEAFLDQVVTWREVGVNSFAHDPDASQFESLPAWARETLTEHADDERPHVYTLEEFEAAQTHEPLWNAAQRQLREDGIIHNYLRMLWGKKILHWSRSPEEALDIMVHLNNRWALDGRDPNSYSGIRWVLGKFDRAWVPKREVFGAVRYMTCDSARRKLKLGDYLDRWGDQGDLFQKGKA